MTIPALADCLRNPDVRALVDALEAMRVIAPKAIKAILYQGRDGLFLADEIHKADDKARAALATIETQAQDGPKGKTE